MDTRVPTTTLFRSGPGLAGDSAHVMDDDPGFLAPFPRDRLLDRFAHLDKARERRIATGREPRLAGKQDMIVMDRKHDDDRVGSRKMIRLATVAATCPTAPGDRERVV